MTAIGFVGLGAMGSRIAGRLLEGNRLYGTNRTAARASGLIGQGMIWRDTPREVASASEVVFSMVTDDAALEAITAGREGILAGLAPGAIYVDMSTVSPRASRDLAVRVRERGANMLDAPVSGSVTAAAAGTLAIIASGPREAFEAVGPLLRRLGSPVTYVGDSGRALVLKLAINISLAAQMVAFSEGMALARRSGISPDLAAEVMAGSAIGSPALRGRVPLMLDLPDDAWFDVELMHKDIRLARDAAESLRLSLPSVAVSDGMLERAERMGYGRRDIAALYQIFSAGSGSGSGSGSGAAAADEAESVLSGSGKPAAGRGDA